MNLDTQTFTQGFESTVFPEPDWKTHVERWYQLDPPSFMLCETYWQNREALTRPDLVMLVSPQGSFATDQRFCQTLSPSKFVHTLPNVRTSALFQLAKWRGPMQSFVDSPEKIRSHAESLVDLGIYRNVWVITILEHPELKVEWTVVRQPRGQA